MNSLEETDKLTQLYVNTMNIKALADQLKYIQQDHQNFINRLSALESSVANLVLELNQIKQILQVVKALSLGSRSTVTD